MGQFFGIFLMLLNFHTASPGTGRSLPAEVAGADRQAVPEKGRDGLRHELLHPEQQGLPQPEHLREAHSGNCSRVPPLLSLGVPVLKFAATGQH